MLTKPESCKGCPLYQTGQGFVPDEMRDGTEVLVMGQNPGADEEAKGMPFVGSTGQSMEKTFLPLPGLDRDSISIGNAIRCRWRNTNELPPLNSVVVREAIEHCHRNHFKMPTGTKLIVTQGEYSLFAMTQHGLTKYDKVGDWRGYVLPYQPVGSNWTMDVTIWNPASDARIPVLATYHLAYLPRDATAGLMTKLDWIKIRKILDGKWPKPLPKIQDGPPSVWPFQSAFDTEFDPTTKHFICYSLAYPSVKDGSIIVRVSDQLSPGLIVESTSQLPPTVVMHNANADIPFLQKMLPAFDYEDTMHAHAVLWSDFPHDLGFLGSVYGSLNRWKHLDRINPRMYSAGDAYGTWEAWREIKREFGRDQASEKIYRSMQLPLVPIIMAAESSGIRINQERAKEAYLQRQVIIDRLNAQAQAAVGWPINLRSNDQVKKQLFEIEGLIKLIGGKK